MIFLANVIFTPCAALIAAFQLSFGGLNTHLTYTPKSLILQGRPSIFSNEQIGICCRNSCFCCRPILGWKFYGLQTQLREIRTFLRKISNNAFIANSRFVNLRYFHHRLRNKLSHPSLATTFSNDNMFKKSDSRDPVKP